MAGRRPPLASGPPDRGYAAGDALPATLARAAIGFLAGPGRAALRVCRAPTVRPLLRQGAPGQEWCAPSCGNRARVARRPERGHRTPHSQVAQ
ncbi:hypothetical protein [Streptomyces sp. NPDC059460]|uniref:hypothetical protein n=1 Tax=Streptomyces sp. NPDC059460 TaxID=3346840 RepID=UPI0036760A8C